MDRGKVVASFGMGTQKLYDYIDNNPLFAFHPTEYVNDPFVIGQQHKMVAINTALEVDLTGQVCADSWATGSTRASAGRWISTAGRRASPRRPGRHRHALHRPEAAGLAHRCPLEPGAGVVTTRGDVHYVVTEYGVAYLHGKSVQERAMALITIAHPNFREQLLREAIEAKYVRPEMRDVEGRSSSARRAADSLLLVDGTQIISGTCIPPTCRGRRTCSTRCRRRPSTTASCRSRSVFRAADAGTSSTSTTATRWRWWARFPRPRARRSCVGRYYLDPKTNRAEVAFVVRDRWQNLGVGTFLLSYLTNIAKSHGISGFTAEVLRTTSRCRLCSTRAKAASPAGWKATCIVTAWISCEKGRAGAVRPRMSSDDAKRYKEVKMAGSLRRLGQIKGSRPLYSPSFILRSALSEKMPILRKVNPPVRAPALQASGGCQILPAGNALHAEAIITDRDVSCCGHKPCDTNFRML